MKILFILDLYKPHIGGVEILFENIISRLVKQGNKIVILTSKYNENLSKYEKISDNLEIYRVGNNRYDFMFYSILKGIKIARDSDIIHTTTYNSAIPAAIIGKISGKKIVLTVHEIFGQLWYKFIGWKGFFFKLFESIIFKFTFDKYICVSNYTKNSIRLAFGLDDNKLITIYNAIDYDKWNIDNIKIEDIDSIIKKYNLNNHYTGLYFGRPGISKGLEFYIKSIPKVKQNIPNFKAFIIAPKIDKPRIKYIESLINKLNINDSIIWLDGANNNELPNYILACNFVIIPSLAEGFGFAAAEVSALGQKLIVSNIASLTEVVSGKIHFIEPSSIKNIEKGIYNIYNNNYEEIRKKEFLWETNLSQTLDVYRELIGK